MKRMYYAIGIAFFATTLLSQDAPNPLYGQLDDIEVQLARAGSPWHSAPEDERVLLGSPAPGPASLRYQHGSSDDEDSWAGTQSDSDSEATMPLAGTGTPPAEQSNNPFEGITFVHSSVLPPPPPPIGSAATQYFQGSDPDDYEENLAQALERSRLEMGNSSPPPPPIPPLPANMPPYPLRRQRGRRNMHEHAQQAFTAEGLPPPRETLRQALGKIRKAIETESDTSRPTTPEPIIPPPCAQSSARARRIRRPKPKDTGHINRTLRAAFVRQLMISAMQENPSSN